MAENTTYLSLSQAAEETGKSKSVISKALKSGKLSHNGKDENGYKIDPAELFRVFPKNSENGSKNIKKERSRTPENDIENAFKIKELELKLEVETKEKSFYKEQYSKMETDRDDWKNQAQKLLLAAPEKPLEASNQNNESRGVNNQKTSTGQRMVTYGAIFFVLLTVGFMSWVLWPEIENRFNGAEVGSLEPASGDSSVLRETPTEP